MAGILAQRASGCTNRNVPFATSPIRNDSDWCCSSLAVVEAFRCSARCLSANSGEHTPLACWFESLAIASCPLQRQLAETHFSERNPAPIRAHDCGNDMGSITGAA